MPKLPRITGSELMKIFQKLGFETSRTKGSHYILKHPDGRRAVIPIHKGETIGPGLFSKILYESETSIEDIQKFL